MHGRRRYAFVRVALGPSAIFRGTSTHETDASYRDHSMLAALLLGLLAATDALTECQK